MPFRKGNKLGKGRPAGQENKISQPIRETLKDIVEGELPRLKKNLRAIEKKSKIQHAELVLRINEYVLPKLNRLEVREVNVLDELTDLPDDARLERMRELATQILKQKNNEKNKIAP
jgi:hypothetical protein